MRKAYPDYTGPDIFSLCMVEKDTRFEGSFVAPGGTRAFADFLSFCHQQGPKDILTWRYRPSTTLPAEHRRVDPPPQVVIDTFEVHIKAKHMVRSVPEDMRFAKRDPNPWPELRASPLLDKAARPAPVCESEEFWQGEMVDQIIAGDDAAFQQKRYIIEGRIADCYERKAALYVQGDNTLVLEATALDLVLLRQDILDLQYLAEKDPSYFHELMILQDHENIMRPRFAFVRKSTLPRHASEIDTLKLVAKG